MKKLILSVILSFTIISASFSQKFAFVDTDYILENIPEYEAAKYKLEDISVEWQKEIEAKFSEIDKLYKAYQSEEVLLPEDIKKKREDEIIEKEKQVKELQKQKFGKDGDLFKKRQELIKPIQDKVYNAISELAENENIAIIFDKSGSLTMLYSNPKYDKSDVILDKLGYGIGTKKEE